MLRVIKKSIFVNDKTIQAEGLGNLFKNLGRSSAKAGEKMATNVMNILGLALRIRAKNGTAALSKNL